MKSYQSFGEQYRLQHGVPTDEHEMFHDFLLISPSYRVAHKVMTGQSIDTSVIEKNTDWKTVLDTYKLCGDVYSKPFIEWWEATGRNLFYTQQSDGTFVNQGPFKLQSNKINEETLFKALCLVNDKARIQKRDGKRVENWRLGVEVGLKSKWVEQLQGEVKKSISNDEARRELGTLVSRKLHQALAISENAARGKFPCDEIINSKLEFDYENQFEITFGLLGIQRKVLQERYVNGQYVQKRHLAYLKPPSKAKLKERAIQGALRAKKAKENDGS